MVRKPSAASMPKPVENNQKIDWESDINEILAGKGEVNLHGSSSSVL